MKIDEYLNTLTEQIRCKKACRAVEEEVRQHMEDQRDALLHCGMEWDEAELIAVQDMGDPVEAGIAFDKIHRPKMAWGAIGFVLVLNLVGAGVQYLLSLQIMGESYSLQGIAKQLLFVIFGALVTLVVCYVDYSRIGRWARQITILLFIGIVVGRMLIGRQMNGARLWLGIGGTSINILILLFLSLPLYGAILYNYRNQGYRALVKSLMWMTPALIIAISGPSLTAMLMLLFSMVITLSVAVYKGWFNICKKITLVILWCSVTMLPVILVGGLWLFGAPYQSARVRAVISGAEGYHMRMIYDMLSSSRLLGKGETGDVLLSTDFSLVFVSAYWGILAGVLLIAAVVFLLSYLLHLSLRQKNPLGMIMGVGCISILFTSLVFYILGNAGILPSGYYCPFFTSGISGITATSIFMGLMLSIYRYQNVVGELLTARGNVAE